MSDTKSRPAGRKRLFTRLLDDAHIVGIARVAPAVDLDDPATCVVCGCTDRRACPGQCFWVSVDRDDGTGLCSSCVPEA